MYTFTTLTMGERVKIARKKKGYTQEELAFKLGYKSRSSVNKIEKERDIPRSMIVKLAELLDVTPAYLMGWTDDSNPRKLNFEIGPPSEEIWEAENERAEEKESMIRSKLDDLVSKLYQLDEKEIDKLIEEFRTMTSVALNNMGIQTND